MNITFEEYLKSIEEKENATKEPYEVTAMFKENAEAIINLAEQPKVKICSDYDCDGLTSAYIMRQTLLAINPEMEVEVEPNDRRKAYGVDTNIENAENVPHIILDMGSNQLDLLDSNIGKDRYIVVDHHIIEDEQILARFQNNSDGTLCNPHCYHQDDSLNAQYCTAGLTYRIYEECKEKCKELEKPFHTSEKQENTVIAMSAIGTASDVVNVLDVHSHNRDILRKGIQAIDNATKENFDLKVGCMLTLNRISEHTTATELAFNTGAFINSTSRMCEVMNDNGAKRFFNAMTDDKCKGYSFAKELEYLQSMNKLRKEITDKVYTTEQFKEFTKEHTTGNKVTDNIGVFVVPKESDIPHNLVGLIANRLSSNTDKSIIVLVQKQDGNYTGSGRGGSSVATSLYDFTKEIAQENNLTMEFGGHKQAIGISNLPQEELGTFLQAIENNLDRVQTISNEEKYTFPITEFLREDGLEMLAKFEPIGQGNRLPFVECEGKEICKNSGFKKSREDWKDVKFSLSIDGKTEKITSTDWSYSPDKYLNDDKGNISFTAELGTNTYRGETRLQLTSRFDRLQYIERAKELGKIEDKSSDKQSEKDDEHDEFDL